LTPGRYSVLVVVISGWTVFISKELQQEFIENKQKS
jgi:hypothetical protein